MGISGIDLSIRGHAFNDYGSLALGANNTENRRLSAPVKSGLLFNAAIFSREYAGNKRPVFWGIPAGRSVSVLLAPGVAVFKSFSKAVTVLNIHGSNKAKKPRGGRSYAQKTINLSQRAVNARIRC